MLRCLKCDSILEIKKLPSGDYLEPCPKCMERLEREKSAGLSNNIDDDYDNIEDAYEDGHSDGYDEGYSDGFEEGKAQSGIDEE
jgi:flagellar biosynthesis/type III secretory pathway protein FliH